MFDRKSKHNPQTSTKAPAAEPVVSSAKPAAPTSRPAAMIGSTVKVLGEIISDENLFVEGEVEGAIRLDDHELTIGPSGRIHANITAKIVKIDGLVDGDIVGKEKVVISKSGNVRGNIVAPRVILEDGGQFKGSIDMGPGIGQGRTSDVSLSDIAPISKAPKSDTPPVQAALKTN